jgi:hypothetical protein
MRPALIALLAAGSPAAQFDLVVLRCHNCVNDRYRRTLGDDPSPAWRRFLSAWQIRERVVENLPAGQEPPPR